MGESAYTVTAETWMRFVTWCRYNLLQFRIGKTGSPFRKLLWEEQRTALRKMIAGTLQSRCYALPADRSVEELAKSIKESVCRGRAPMTLRELLGGDLRGGDFTFDFIIRRVELRDLPGAVLPQWRIVSDRADRFRAAMMNRSGKQGSNPVASPRTGGRVSGIFDCRPTQAGGGPAHSPERR